MAYYWLLLLPSVVLGDHCPLTSNDVPGPYFEENAPNAIDIAPPDELRQTGEVFVKGVVMDKSCNPIPEAIIDIWYAGGEPTKEEEYKGFTYSFPPAYLWYRGKQTTSKAGKYHFHATYPHGSPQRPIAHYHIKVVTREMEFITQIYFKDDIAPGYENYMTGRDTQFPEVEFGPGEFDAREIKFNIVLDQ